MVPVATLTVTRLTERQFGTFVRSRIEFSGSREGRHGGYIETTFDQFVAVVHLMGWTRMRLTRKGEHFTLRERKK